MKFAWLTEAELRAIRSALPGLLVFVSLLVLLRGFAGTADALRVQLSLFATSFLGGDGEQARVLLHTLPLAVAAAVAAFAIASGWLRFESSGSIVVLAVMVMAGAAVGGFLRSLVPDRAGVPDRADMLMAERPPVKMIRSAQPGRGQTGVVLMNQPLQSSLRSISADAVEQPTARKSALQQLLEIDWLAVPNMDNAPPANIPPLNLFPKASGVIGAVLLGANQLLGYLVFYQPRLFLAAVLAGGWFGWSWQRRLTQWRARVSGQVGDSPGMQRPRRAA